MIRLIKGDITKVADVDAIVNAANRTLLGGGGVDGAIHRAAGRGLRAECLKLRGCKTGDAKITKGYNLPCQYVIHTVGPIWHGGGKGEPEMLSACYRNSLRVAQENGIRRIAFPSISTGVFHYPVDRAAETAMIAVRQYLEDNPGSFDLVEWVLFEDFTYAAYENAAKSLLQCVDIPAVPQRPLRWNRGEGLTTIRERGGGRRRSRDAVVLGAAADQRGEDYHPVCERWHVPSASATPWDGADESSLTPGQALVMAIPSMGGEKGAIMAPEPGSFEQPISRHKSLNREERRRIKRKMRRHQRDVFHARVVDGATFAGTMDLPVMEVWADKGSADPAIWIEFEHAFSSRFPDGDCTDEASLAFAREYLASQGAYYASIFPDGDKTPFLELFDKETDLAEWTRMLDDVERQDQSDE